jgi:RHS repeat-associated protein
LGIDEYLARTTGGVTEHYLTDALGSTVGLTDGPGALGTEYSYAPFGAATASGPSSSNELGYTGREDDGTGVYYYRARYYHPTLQRFISEDPIGFAAGDINFYVYVANNPINFTDPFGLDKEKKCAQVPLAPTGVSVDTNIRLAEQLSVAPIDPLFGYGEWLGRVWLRGAWDYKRRGLAYETFGNFNYGATGAAMGIPQDVLLRAAGLVQMVNGPCDPSNGYPWWRSLYGDQPWDQDAIRAGYQYYWCKKI